MRDVSGLWKRLPVHGIAAAVAWAMALMRPVTAGGMKVGRIEGVAKTHSTLAGIWE